MDVTTNVNIIQPYRETMAPTSTHPHPYHDWTPYITGLTPCPSSNRKPSIRCISDIFTDNDCYQQKLKYNQYYIRRKRRTGIWFLPRHYSTTFKTNIGRDIKYITELNYVLVNKWSELCMKETNEWILNPWHRDVLCTVVH